MAEVLEHEQGHFDIAQQFNQKLRMATRNLVGSVHACGGQNERRATRNAEREISRLVGSVYDEIWQQYTSAQDAYDRETVHGIDRGAQARWTRSIATGLEKRGH